jgi:hypothetical protein
MRTCTQCNEAKPLASFYRHPYGRDGLQDLCKDCQKHNVKARRLTNPYVQQYERERAKTPERRARVRIISDRWRKENPVGYRAHSTLSNAVRDGKIAKQPCALCGATKHIHAHHKDYVRPLSVTWLCAKCHHRVHATFPELGANMYEAAKEQRQQTQGRRRTSYEISLSPPPTPDQTNNGRSK